MVGGVKLAGIGGGFWMLKSDLIPRVLTEFLWFNGPCFQSKKLRGEVFFYPISSFNPVDPQKKKGL